MTDQNGQEKKGWFKRNLGNIFPAMVFVFIVASALLMRMCNT
ncbi:MAG: hypothetical protein PHU25_08625 [Deltaproteobacteria bacterium]|nr:hypothetical protein [Deltaproteobacteria bacterium]